MRNTPRRKSHGLGLFGSWVEVGVSDGFTIKQGLFVERTLLIRGISRFVNLIWTAGISIH